MPSRGSDPRSPGVIFWFRDDLRLHDQLALAQAMERSRQSGGWLLPLHVHDDRWHALTPWGFRRAGEHRLAWRRMAVQDLSANLSAIGSALLQSSGDPVELISRLAYALGQPLVVCEDIAAPEEQAQIQALRRRGVQVETVWQSTLMAPGVLPLLPENVPDRFTSFRQMLEGTGVRATAPLQTPQSLPPLPDPVVLQTSREVLRDTQMASKPPAVSVDPRASFPWGPDGFHGGETAALAHLAHYCRRGLPHTYKSTRNGLLAVDDSSKWSPWLATGALSARKAWAAVQEFETVHGASESTYWLGFELLWRDHFRWLHRKHGSRLYTASGLTGLPPPPHDPGAFQAWCNAQTGEPFIDAGMRELAATGYLSNRMRQNVASYLIHDLACDWRAGAAWFEACLIDYDVCSNQGNWLYLSGRGTDPRPNRRFNPQWQAQTYDPDGRYRRTWAA